MRLLQGDFFLVTWNEIVLAQQLMFPSCISWYIFPCQLTACELLSPGDFVPCSIQGRIFKEQNSDGGSFSLTGPIVIQYLYAYLHLVWWNYFHASTLTEKDRRTSLCFTQTMSIHRNYSLVIQPFKAQVPWSETQPLLEFVGIKVTYMTIRGFVAFYSPH